MLSGRQLTGSAAFLLRIGHYAEELLKPHQHNNTTEKKPQVRPAQKLKIRFLYLCR